ncbi:restriction endonuclease [Streptomyces sp. KR55]|uniref:restriction endonuclease n=1 Tax=Streptomyces sp. KR55 TaxID=3457425 RepID=UPI003FD64571
MGRRTGLQLRPPRGRGEHLAAVVVLAAAAWLLARTTAAVGEWAVRGWPFLAAAAAAALAYTLTRLQRAARQRQARAAALARLRITLTAIDAMGDREFEYSVRDLLIRDGWQARQTGRAGDQGADVIAEHPVFGRLVVQAKHTTVTAKVSSPVMYQVKGTAWPVHHADVAVVVTNGHLTRDARAWGARHQIHFADRDRLRQWAEDGTPLHQMLRLQAPARRRTRRPQEGMAER